MSNTKGRVLVDGTDMTQIDPRDIRRNVGYLGQDVRLFAGSLRDNLNLTPLERDDDRLLEALDFAGMGQFVRGHHKGLDLDIRDGGDGLSTGQRQSIGWARLWLQDPRVVLLDEPTAGVDVELRHDMWRIVTELKEKGVTIILTTHYIEEAEEMADRVGVINKGEIVLVEGKAELMRKLGRKLLTLNLTEPLEAVPDSLARHNLEIADAGCKLVYTYDTHAERTGITALLQDLADAGVRFQDLQTDQSSLEDIFVDLVKKS